MQVLLMKVVGDYWLITVIWFGGKYGTGGGKVDEQHEQVLCGRTDVVIQ